MSGNPLDETQVAPDVRDLDASAVLDAAVAARRVADAEEARLLALAVHWVDLHPATDQHPAAMFPAQRTGGLASALGPGFFDQAPLGGVGTPAVAAYAVEELSAALGLSHSAGFSLVSEAVELCHRLPGPVGAGAGRPVAGLEGPPGGPGHHRALRRRGGVRGPAPGGHGPAQPAARP
jgi:hypothetical protein